MDRNKNKQVAYTLRHKGLTWDSIGRNLGVSRKTAKRLCDEYIDTTVQPEIPLENVIPIDRFKPLHIHGDALVSCDWHVPLHSPKLVNDLLTIGSDSNARQLIIAGDFLNLDTFSHFLPHQPEAAFEIEKQEATSILDTCLEVFDHIYMSWGNHEHRITKFLNFKFSFEYCMRWILAELGEEKLSRITFSELDHVVYHPGPYDIRICHQKNFSGVPLAVPLNLAKKYEMSVMTAHSHHFAQGVSLSGKHRIFEGGGLFDAHRTEYVQRTSTHHVWTQGFYLFQDGLVESYSPLYGNL